jgi:hypothetical protein
MSGLRLKVFSLFLFLCAAGNLPAQVHHLRPSTKAGQVGEDLPWIPSVDQALQLAKKQGKKVLWYVPRVPGTPMDRLPELDLYMRAGFFAEPLLQPVLKSFVLCREVPRRKAARRWNLRPFQFIEPGFLVLDPKGKELLRRHALSTFSPYWFRGQLAQVAQVPPLLLESATKNLLQALGGGDAKAALAFFQKHPKGSSAWRFLGATAAFLAHKEKLSDKILKSLADGPGPLASRAATELEGFGPLRRGFWTWRFLPEDPSPKALGTSRTRKLQDLPMLRERSIAFLLRMQRANGGFEDSNYDFGGLDSLPNVYCAVTALALQALLENRRGREKRLDPALARGLKYLLDPKNYADGDRDEWTWAKVFPIQLFSRMLETEQYCGLGEVFLRQKLQGFILELASRQQNDGSFRHEYRNPFVTASVLWAMKLAKAQGAKIPKDLVSRAVISLQHCRGKKGGFSYSQWSGKKLPRVALVRAAGRMPLCESALFVWGASDKKRLKAALETALNYHRELERARKYDDHTSPHIYGGFFYFYDLLGRSLACRALLKKSPRLAQLFRKDLQKRVLATSEIDGTFIDSHELGRSYGTAMALLCLQ